MYKRLLPTLGDFITDHGGQVNLSHVDVILAEVGAIEDYVFQMKHQNEVNDKKRRREFKERKKQLTGKGDLAPRAGYIQKEPEHKVRGRAARILEKKSDLTSSSSSSLNGKSNNGALIAVEGKEHVSRNNTKEVVKKSAQDNARAAAELRAKLMNGSGTNVLKPIEECKDDNVTTTGTETTTSNEPTEESRPSPKRKVDLISTEDDGVATNGESNDKENDESKPDEDEESNVCSADTTDEVMESNVSSTDNADDKEDSELSNGNDKDEQLPVEDPGKLLKDKMKEVTQKKLNDYAENVDDKVRLHESGWKVRLLFFFAFQLWN